MKFLVFFPLSTNNILTFVEDFKSIPVPSKEISSSEVEQIFEFLTLLSFPLVVLLCHTRSYESLSKKIRTTGSFETKNGAVRSVGRSGCSKCVESRVLAYLMMWKIFRFFPTRKIFFRAYFKIQMSTLQRNSIYRIPL